MELKTHLPIKEAEYCGNQETLHVKTHKTEIRSAQTAAQSTNYNYNSRDSFGFWSCYLSDLVVHEDLHDVGVDLVAPVVVGLVGQQDVLDAEQRDEDERGPHRPHVQAGLGLVRHPQLGDEHLHDVEQEEEVHLESHRGRMRSSDIGLSNSFRDTLVGDVPPGRHRWARG